MDERRWRVVSHERLQQQRQQDVILGEEEVGEGWQVAVG